MHPREFFGPTIKKEVLGSKKSKVEVINHHDFYLRIKLASIRKKLTPNASLNSFLGIDMEKYPNFVQVKRMIKALEIVAENEQEAMIKEAEQKAKLMEKTRQERVEQGLSPEPTDMDSNISSKGSPEKSEKDKAKDKDFLGEKNKKDGELEQVLKIGGGSKKEKK